MSMPKGWTVFISFPGIKKSSPSPPFFERADHFFLFSPEIKKSSPSPSSAAIACQPATPSCPRDGTCSILTDKTSPNPPIRYNRYGTLKMRW